MPQILTFYLTCKEPKTWSAFVVVFLEFLSALVAQQRVWEKDASCNEYFLVSPACSSEDHLHGAFEEVP